MKFAVLYIFIYTHVCTVHTQCIVNLDHDPDFKLKNIFVHETESHIQIVRPRDFVTLQEIHDGDVVYVFRERAKGIAQGSGVLLKCIHIADR